MVCKTNPQGLILNERAEDVQIYKGSVGEPVEDCSDVRYTIMNLHPVTDRVVFLDHSTSFLVFCRLFMHFKVYLVNNGHFQFLWQDSRARLSLVDIHIFSL